MNNPQYSQRKWAVATEVARKYRRGIKQNFALEYATYLFGTGAEKFNWEGRMISDFAEIVLSVPGKIRTEVYARINAIRDDSPPKPKLPRKIKRSILLFES